MLPQIMIACHLGVFVYRPGIDKSPKKILDTKGNYGITFSNGWWHIVHRDVVGWVQAYRFDNEFDVIESKPIIEGLHNPHQIDFVDQETLCICNTYKNEIILMDQCGHTKSFFPTGQLDKIREKNTPIPPNYSHFNSVICRHGMVHLMAHNGTRVTNKTSQIFVGEFGLGWGQIETNAGNAHNIVINEGYYYYCNSLNGGLMRMSTDLLVPEIFFPIKGFSRGLSITDDHIVVGESWIGESADREMARRGWIHFLDKRANLLETVVLDNIGQVHEVRTIDRPDYGWSNPFCLF